MNLRKVIDTRSDPGFHPIPDRNIAILERTPTGTGEALLSDEHRRFVVAVGPETATSEGHFTGQAPDECASAVPASTSAEST